MRSIPLLLCLALALPLPAAAEVGVSISIGLPNVSIGLRVPVYQDLEPIPGYPVYYAPRLRANYFFYDGMYWVYEGDDWFASEWYDGPWYRIDRYEVPVFVLRIPVRYYRAPPRAFAHWRADAPPRWNEHWGRQWAQRRAGWDRWDRRSAPARPPAPTYQRGYSGSHYPRGEQQRRERERHYRYEPREPVVRQRYHAPVRPGPRPHNAPAQPQRPVQGHAPPREQPQRQAPPKHERDGRGDGHGGGQGNGRGDHGGGKDRDRHE